MRTLTGTIVSAVMLSSCDSTPVSKKPSTEQVIGIWECSTFPPNVLKEAGIESGALTSRIEIRRNGKCTATQFPQRAPYRIIDVPSSAWTLTEPSVTPSGTWSLEFSGNFLQCRSEGESLVFRYWISGKDNYKVDYKRAHQGNGAKGD